MAFKSAVYKVGWDPSNLKEVLSKSGLSYKQVSEVTGIPLATISQCLSGRIVPNVSAVTTLADYFGVSVDYLCGREPLPEEFNLNFMLLRRADYEATLQHRQDIAPLGRYGDAPWPYNLLDDIVCHSGWTSHKTEEDFWDAVITPDQEAALTYLLSSTFPERTQTMLRLYYKEEWTLDTVGKEVGLTRERVRQVLARAVRQLRHPSRFKMLVYGLDGYERFSAIRQKVRELEIEEDRVDELEKELIRRRMYLEATLQEVPVPETVPKPSKSVWDITLEEMDLSVRSFNCLRRAGCQNISDVCKVASEGSLLKVQNFGRRSLAEVLSKVQMLTGEDYRGVYAR